MNILLLTMSLVQVFHRRTGQSIRSIMFFTYTTFLVSILLIPIFQIQPIYAVPVSSTEAFQLDFLLEGAELKVITNNYIVGEAPSGLTSNLTMHVNGNNPIPRIFEVGICLRST
jgi:hypothetical protein